MFSGFWGWFLVVVIIACVFGASNLPHLKEEVIKFFNSSVKCAKQKRNEVENKITEVKEKARAAKEESARKAAKAEQARIADEKAVEELENTHKKS